MAVISEEEKILSGFYPRIRPQIYARGSLWVCLNVMSGYVVRNKAVINYPPPAGAQLLSLSPACTYVDKCIFYTTTNLCWTSR
jgi:hypothetical protein